MKTTHLSGIVKQFIYYKTVGDKAFLQLTFDDMNYQPNDDSNSISVIAKHMVGNMLSRWTNFLNEDGEKEWRNREQEFEGTYKTKEELISAWEDGWNCLFTAISSLKDVDLNRIIYIRNEGHTVAEALYRQLGHYPYHIGQIVYIGKLLKGNQWTSLSIPRGESSNFNTEKFNQDKSRRHFTDQK